jgi:hypothetical protein
MTTETENQQPQSEAETTETGTGAARPKAMKKKAAAKPKRKAKAKAKATKSKAQTAAAKLVALAVRKQGVSHAEACKAVGWKQCRPYLSSSCAAAGIRLRKERAIPVALRPSKPEPRRG